MADYSFRVTLVSDINPGGTIRVLRNGTVKVYNAATDALIFNVETDQNGSATFTTTDVVTVYLVSPNGLTSEHITAASAVEASAAFTVSEDAAVAALVADSGSNTGVAGDARWATLDSNGKQPVHKGELVVNVKDYGATGDGSTDDTAAFNSALSANPGRIIYVPDGTYMIDATAHVTTSPGSQPAGILMDQANTTLRLSSGATLQAITNSSERYSVVQVSAADCVIEGGTVTGDLLTHAGTTGQWGYCIELTYNLTLGTKADRAQVIGTKCNLGWADGIFVVGDPVDIRIVDVVCDSNRRQGMSITDATRPLVLGGHYMNTGTVVSVNNPGAGIDLEPDPGTGRDVVDALLIGVNFTGNMGPGLSVVGATGQILTATIVGCRATNNASINNVGGFYVAGGTGTVVANFYGCTAKDNTLYGFRVIPDGVTLSGCMARGNGQYGFRFGAAANVSDCHAELNGLHGFSFDAAATGAKMTGGTSRANSQTTNNGAANVEVYTTMTIAGHVSDIGSQTNKPAYAFLIRSGANVRLFGCDAVGFTTAVLDSAGNTVMFPKPGVAKQTLAVAATDATTTQTLANSLRTALIALGYAS